MTPEKIQQMAFLLNERERHETQRDGFLSFQSWRVKSNFEINGSRFNSESWRMSFTLDPQETGEVMDVLKKIYQRRVDGVTASLVAEGVDA
jgi:hypothetical protein